MSDVSKRPNILIVLTDQQRFPTSYEPEGLRQWRRDEFVAERSLRENRRQLYARNYTMATACAPSRASLLTGQYEGTAGGASPIAKLAKRLRLYSTVVQPNHVETVIAEVDVEGERHLAKLSRYFDNAQFWTIPGEHDERLRRRKTMIVTEPEPDEYELYDLTADPLEQRNLAHPSHATEESRRLQREMRKLLVDQLASKRVVPTTGVVPGYQSPNAA